jgi:N-acetylmuramate 1-kinase
MTMNDKIIDFARAALEIPAAAHIELIPFGGRGSDRTYYRIQWDRKKSAILSHYNPNRIENPYFVDIGLFLSEINVSTPKIIRHDPTACFIAIEDLGDTDLWSLRSEPWKTRKPLYEESLAIAHRLHSFPERQFPSNRVKLMESFGPDLYRWERDYFRDNFVGILCGIKSSPAFDNKLEAELAGLADRLSTSRPNLVHRDLQSQNIMICEGKPYLIDFQGMRFGTRFYDLGSLLFDPYVSFSETERKELLSFYFRLPGNDLEWGSFLNAFYEASVQRLMQALGCYGYLGLTKGLKSYLAHVPNGIQNLQIAAEKCTSLPCLQELTIRCKNAWI